MPDAPRIDCRVHALPKAGNSAEEYEDRWAVDDARLRFAVADGASESSFAGPWAELLVNRFVEEPTVVEADGWDTWLPPPQERWCRDVVGDRQLPWFAEVKVARGAYAAFLGLELDAAARWRAVAVGDTCLFHVRDDAVLRAVPVERAADFTRRPWLLGSRTPPDEVARLGKACRADGEWAPGDRFLLMTDALSQWFLGQCELNCSPAELADYLLTGTEADFARTITELRQLGELNNDDVTLVHVRVLDAAA